MHIINEIKTIIIPLIDRIWEQITTCLPIKDYIIEKGTDTSMPGQTWKYVKWHSGMVEAWGTIDASALALRAYFALGSTFYSPDNGSNSGHISILTIPSGIFSKTPDYGAFSSSYSQGTTDTDNNRLFAHTLGLISSNEIAPQIKSTVRLPNGGINIDTYYYLVSF